MHDDHHDRGLAHDLVTLAFQCDRRQLLRLLAGASLIPFIGCDSGGDGSGNPDGGTSSSTCTTIPEETAGPYPGDGSNGANALSLSGIVRTDIRSSIGGATGVAEGVPLTVKLKLVDSGGACAALEGYAIYLWHCNREGQYSMYTLPSENYLRGVQATDADGSVTFTTIFPGCYSGRMPHIHFEIYPTLASATASGNKVATSQLAFPEDVCDDVYATTGYSQSVANFAQISFASDNVFSDGVGEQMATVTGSVSEGYVASLTVGIEA